MFSGRSLGIVTPKDTPLEVKLWQATNPKARDFRLEAVGPIYKSTVLTGGADFWSNGIHLNVIEASDQPAEESMRNIEAIDDLLFE